MAYKTQHIQITENVLEMRNIPILSLPKVKGDHTCFAPVRSGQVKTYKYMLLVTVTQALLFLHTRISKARRLRNIHAMFSCWLKYLLFSTSGSPHGTIRQSEQLPGKVSFQEDTRLTGFGAACSSQPYPECSGVFIYTFRQPSRKTNHPVPCLKLLQKIWYP